MPSPKNSTLLPYAADGSCFNSSLRCPKSGAYIVGEEGKELSFDDFDDALEHIKMMYTPKWRRPNASGDWEIVSAVQWELSAQKYLAKK